MPPAVKSPSLPPALAKQLGAAVESKLRRRLGLKPGDATPAELTKLIADEIGTTGAPLLKTKVAAEVQSTLSGLGQPRTLERFKENLGLAQAGIGVIAQAAEVDDILNKRAQLLFKKKTALETAGFTVEQSMQIVLADIGAKAH
jgi:hypothetical protein